MENFSGQYRQSMSMSHPNLASVLTTILKYVIEGSAVAVAAFVIPQKKIALNEVVMIALTGAAVFAVLDMFAPSVGGAARHGAGLGIGASMVGALGMQPIGNAGLPLGGLKSLVA
jgi:ABC-type Co2+ transport system permease subunit